MVVCLYAVSCTCPGVGTWRYNVLMYTVLMYKATLFWVCQRTYAPVSKISVEALVL